jgi:hypothetical protein
MNAHVRHVLATAAAGLIASAALCALRARAPDERDA